MAPICLAHQTMLILVLFVSIGLVNCQVVRQPSSIGITTFDLVRQRGYIAENHYVTTADGYILNVVRAINPLINNKRSGRSPNLKTPVLFIHGTATNANCFLINSRGARPRDYTSVAVNSMSEMQLNQLLARDPARFSVPLTLLNFGHEVWLLNRRGTFQSTGHIRRDMQPFRTSAREVARMFRSQLGGQPRNLLHTLAMGFKFLGNLVLPGIPAFNFDLNSVQNSVNMRYWNFSLDEQARYDFPATLDYVLKKTNTNRNKLILVGHSLGSTIPLMALSMSSKLDNKIERSLLYSPALYNRGNMYNRIGIVASPLLDAYVGPFPSSMVVDLARLVVELACSTPILQATACSATVQVLFGRDGGQETISADAADVALDTFASRDIGQLAQCFQKGKCHLYDHLTDNRNRVAYGLPYPPPYNVTRVTSRTISLWNGNTDTLVPLASTARLASELTVPVERYFIQEPGIYWNHVSYFFHTQIPRLITIPSLKLVSRPTRYRREASSMHNMTE